MSKTGRNISNINTEEKEILFKRNKKFKVIKKELKDEKYKIILKEIDKDG